MVGETIGKVQLISRIGDGAMGEVYRGQHLTLGVPVAVKFLKPELASDTKLRQRFVQEAQLAARLRHPNIVRVYDVGEERGYHYMVMEFLEGLTLDHFVHGASPVHPELFLRLAIQIAAALGEAHDNGIVHRDVKPGNVIVGEGPRAVLTDFGIAGALAVDIRLTTPGLLLGTPAYMSPEQAKGSPNLDARADVFALGVMLWEILAGRLPQENENVLHLMHTRINEDIIPIARVVPTVPDPIGAVVTRCLVRTPEARYSSCCDVLSALRQAQKTLFPKETPDAERPREASEVRALDLPREETEALASGVDIKYTDLQVIFATAEGSPTGYALVALQYPDMADVLLFKQGALTGCYRWSGGVFAPLPLDGVYEQQRLAPKGVIDSMQISERYYNAFERSVIAPPSIGGMRLAFVSPSALFDYLRQERESGVLRIELGGRIGFVLFREGNANNIFCSNWPVPAGGDKLTMLSSSLSAHPRTRIDFYGLSSQALRTSPGAVAGPPFEREHAEAVVQFVVAALQRSGEMLKKQFGLGTDPILRKYLDESADQHPLVLDELDFDGSFSVPAAVLLSRIDSLPRTGRRNLVMGAFATLLEGRAAGIRDALNKGRKLKKGYKQYLEVWKEFQPQLSQKGLAQPFQPIFERIAGEL